MKKNTKKKILPRGLLNTNLSLLSLLVEVDRREKEGLLGCQSKFQDKLNDNDIQFDLKTRQIRLK